MRFRPSPVPRNTIPYGVRSVGLYDVPAGESIDASKPKPFVQLFWSSAGVTEIRHEDRVIALRADHAFILPSGSRHVISAGDAGCRYHWLTLDGALPDAVAQAFGLNDREPRSVGPPPEDLFQQLHGLLQDDSLLAEVAAATVAWSILSVTATGGFAKPVEDIDERFRREILTHVHDVDFSIVRLAEKLGFDRSTMSRMFKRSFGLSPKQYLQSQRLHRAMLLLQSTTLPIQEVAVRTGFSNADYFTRSFREETGATPEKFRAMGKPG
jgi:AraC-like DNA-binding protein